MNVKIKARGNEVAGKKEEKKKNQKIRGMSLGDQKGIVLGKWERRLCEVTKICPKPTLSPIYYLRVRQQGWSIPKGPQAYG